MMTLLETEPTEVGDSSCEERAIPGESLHFVKRSDPVRAVARFTGSNIGAFVDLGFRFAPPQALC